MWCPGCCYPQRKLCRLALLCDAPREPAARRIFSGLLVTSTPDAAVGIHRRVSGKWIKNMWGVPVKYSELPAIVYSCGSYERYS
jgi:hypothetical protein